MVKKKEKKLNKNDYKKSQLSPWYWNGSCYLPRFFYSPWGVVKKALWSFFFLRCINLLVFRYFVCNTLYLSLIYNKIELLQIYCKRETAWWSPIKSIYWKSKLHLESFFDCACVWLFLLYPVMKKSSCIVTEPQLKIYPAAYNGPGSQACTSNWHEKIKRSGKKNTN